MFLFFFFFEVNYCTISFPRQDVRNLSFNDFNLVLSSPSPCTPHFPHPRTILSLKHLEDAHQMDPSGQLTDRHGCPAYVSPEMLQPGSYSGRAADLWSLGVILYTLLVGHYPFFDSSPQNLFSKVRSGYYQVPDSVSYLARSLISSLLAYEPEKRVPAEAILEHPWFTRASDQVPVPPHLDQMVPKNLELCGQRLD